MVAKGNLYVFNSFNVSVFFALFAIFLDCFSGGHLGFKCLPHKL